MQNANNSDQDALNLTTTAVTKRPDVLIIDPVSSEGGRDGEQGHQRLGAGHGLRPAAPAGDVANSIGYDAIAAGKAAADSLAEAVGEKGKVVEIQGIMGTNVAQDRSKGFDEEIKAYPGIHVVATQAADFDRGKALDVMTNVLQAHPTSTASMPRTTRWRSA